LSADIPKSHQVLEKLLKLEPKPKLDYITLEGKIVTNLSSHKGTGLPIELRRLLGLRLFNTFESLSLAAGVVLSGILTELAAIPANYVDQVSAEYRKVAMCLLFGLWFSVENETEENSKYIVARSGDDNSIPKEIVSSALCMLLDDDKVDEETKKEWDEATKYIRGSKIESKAVIVNRRKMAEDAFKGRSDSASKTEGADDILFKLYNGFPGFVKRNTDDRDVSPWDVNKVSDKTYLLFSRRFGVGEGLDYSNLTDIYLTVEKWATQALESHLNHPPSSSEDQVTKDKLLAELLKSLFAELGDLITTKSKTDDVTLDMLIQHLSRKRHQSGVLRFLNKFRKNGFKDSTLVTILEELKSAAKTDVPNCSKQIGDKGPREYLTQLLNKAANTCRILFNPSGDHKNFFFAAMCDAMGRLDSHLASRGRQERQRERYAFEGVEWLKNVDDNTKSYLDEYCDKRKFATDSKDEYLLRHREIAFYEEAYKLVEKIKDLPDEEKTELWSSFLDKLLLKNRGGSPEFLNYILLGLLFPKTKGPSIDIPPKKLFVYVDGKQNLYNATNYKRPMLTHIHPYLSPATMRFGGAWMKVVHNAQKHPNGPDLQKFNINLWDGEKFATFEGKWHSKRIYNALGLGFPCSGPEVTLNTTNGRLAAGVNTDPASPCQVKNLYSKEQAWPTTISPDNDVWQKIWAVQNSKVLTEEEKLLQLEELKSKLNWYIYYNIPLTPLGPVQTMDAKNIFEHKGHDEMLVQPVNRPLEGTGVINNLSWPEPILRIVGCDIGLNNPAALSYIGLYSKSDVQLICIKARAQQFPTEQQRYLDIPVKNFFDDKVERHEIFIRIGPDRYTDGTVNPIPWAWLEDQVILRVEGEFENDKRELANGEMLWLDESDRLLGLSHPYISRIKANGYGNNSENQKARLEEMLASLPENSLTTPNKDTVNNFNPFEISRDAITAFNNLSHSISRVNAGMFSLEKARMGLNEQSVDSTIASIYSLWSLFTMENGIGKFARELLNPYAMKYNEKPLNDPSVRMRWKESKNQKYPGLEELAEKLKTEEIEEIIQAIQDQLYKFIPIVEKMISELDARLFHSEELTNSLANRNMGGLSMERINALKYFVHKVMRPFAQLRYKFQTGESKKQEKDKSKEQEKDESKEQENDKLNIKLIGKNHLLKISDVVLTRHERIISRIIGATLDRYAFINNPACSIGNHVPDLSQSCPIIAIEDLSNLNPSLKRSRRENNIVSALKPGSLKNLLLKQTHRHGIKPIEVDPSETSIFDAMTGFPGIRCREVTGKQFMTNPKIRGDVEHARKRVENGDTSFEYIYWVQLDDRLSALSEELLKQETNVYIPQKGGPLFVSSNPDKPSIVNADLNASLNIALRACTEIDWEGAIRKVLVNENSVPLEKRYGKFTVIPKGKPLLNISQEGDKSKTKDEPLLNPSQEGDESKTKKAIICFLLWRFLSLAPIDQNCVWYRTDEFFAKVRSMAAKNLLKRRYPSYSGPGFDP
jgi:hypothetical protein